MPSNIPSSPYDLHNSVTVTPGYVNPNNSAPVNVMSDPLVYKTLWLNNISFPIDDMPQELQFDGERLLAVKQFPGGGVWAQDLGPYDKSLTISGTFKYIDPETGYTALQRCLAIDDLRMSGKTVTLRAPGGLTRQVRIKSFPWKYHNDFEVDYTLTLIPVDKPGSFSSVATKISSTGSATTQVGKQTVTVGTFSRTTPTPAVSAPKQNTIIRYVVKPGDNLWNIALKELGRGNDFTKIYKENNLKTSVIQPGQVLQIQK